MRDILTVKEAAQFLRKHPDTIRRWVKVKKLPARKLSAGKNGIFVLLRSDILEVMVTETIEKKERVAKMKKKQAARAPRQVQLPI